MTKKIYAGLFLTSLATILFELLLTRIWSVTMWYHFAFVAISVTMFGMTAGALLVYIFPNFFSSERTLSLLAKSSLLFAVSMVWSLFTELCIPWIGNKSILGLYSAVLIYGVAAIPFCLSGICITLSLTRFTRYVSKLYAADLIGAAIGCILFIQLMSIVDGPTAVLLAALIACLAAVLFAWEAKSSRCLKVALTAFLCLGVFAGVNTYCVSKSHSLLSLPWVRGEVETSPLYEKWNAFSRVTVMAAQDFDHEPFGWGLSTINLPKFDVQQLWLMTDGFAVTVLTKFSGNTNDVAFLKWDVSNAVHCLRHNAKVLIIGCGGGRDILSALVFNQKSALAVEINGTMVNILKNVFADFVGHLDKDPRVSIVNDEARSYIERTKDRFDIIQMSVIDSGTASAAGAFALSESSLYTEQAWKLYLSRLNPDGILSCTRWYFPECPGEIYRLVSLARVALKDIGIDKPRDHIIVIRCRRPLRRPEMPNAGTVLVSRQPFTSQDLTAIETLANEKQFDITLSPHFSLDQNLADIASGNALSVVAKKLPVRINPPTDDSPFFFYLLKPENFFNPPQNSLGTPGYFTRAQFILIELLFTVIILTLICCFLPLSLKGSKVKLRESWSFLVYFAAIGFGYMFIEMSQLERLIIFLGHPIYSLTVVLFTLLLSSGIGSYLSNCLSLVSRRANLLCLLSLVLALFLFCEFMPYLLQIFAGAETPVRIMLVSGALMPIGLLMGTAFPIGLNLASEQCPDLAPWLWAINGAGSVCSSVLAVVIAITCGISTACWTGLFCYIIALLCLFCMLGKTAGKPALKSLS